ncbi:hypothetical protein J2X65_001770 [Ancylobacter sp. 3268]|uniref:hypothetical protein n=1 Tax=Ancylobacter sp. 3268 TaxID=2817752 RepID=UPI002863C92F|nr:hypothetical protein [Ancylobacter sp. 3268]MDR6952415.1 hypothetical protein [Ancylobacter sp. 3268]
MSTHQHRHTKPHTDRDEFITIIGEDAEEVSRVYAKDGLAAKGFSILHRMGRHSFRLPEGSPLAAHIGEEAGMRPMVAATYMRRAGS